MPNPWETPPGYKNEWKPCRDCKGSGEIDGKECKRCAGSGKERDRA
jgi:DnaJ-class molecular chaperone